MTRPVLFRLLMAALVVGGGPIAGLVADIVAGSTVAHAGTERKRRAAAPPSARRVVMSMGNDSKPTPAT